MNGLPFICTLCKEQFADAVDALRHEREKHGDNGMSLIGIQLASKTPVEAGHSYTVTKCDKIKMIVPASEGKEEVDLICMFDLGHKGLHFDAHINLYWRSAMVLDGDDPEATQTV